MAENILTDNISEPLNAVTTAKVDIDAGDGNLTIDLLTSGEQVLASGTLQYFENQGLPIRTLASASGQASLTIKRSGARGGSWFHLPWSACNGATDWLIRLNPAVVSDITAHSDGGNIALNLAGITLTRVSAYTGGGNMDVVLPDNAESLSVTAKTGAGNVSVAIGDGTMGSTIVDASSGAGNVVVLVPTRLAARIHATTGLGKVTMDLRFIKIDKNTYQSSDFESAVDKVEITAKSGAGNVIVNCK